MNPSLRFPGGDGNCQIDLLSTKYTKHHTRPKNEQENAAQLQNGATLPDPSRDRQKRHGSRIGIA